MAKPGREEIDAARAEKRHEQLKPEVPERRSEFGQYRSVPEHRAIKARFREKIDTQKRELQTERVKKAEIVEEMVLKDFDLSPDKRRDDVKNLHYRNGSEFDREVQRRHPGLTPGEVWRIEGFYDLPSNQAYVRDTGDTLETATHEKLHQKSRSELPTRLNEGMTEHFTRKELGPFVDLKTFDSRGSEIPKPGSDYIKDALIVGKLEATIGPGPMHKAYFEGNTVALRRETDRALGDGTYEQLVQALENRDYEKANRLFASSEHRKEWD